ncbi:MAG: hypothetical protein IJZ79_01475 [Bacilli bacterium]|nr:hypothetical protein [Bacilli bacterium]
MITGRGNRHAQQKRRRKYNKNIPELEEEYMLIDGNYSRRPAAYCCFHRGYLTGNQIHLHKCNFKNCVQLKSLEWKANHGG